MAERARRSGASEPWRSSARCASASRTRAHATRRGRSASFGARRTYAAYAARRAGGVAELVQHLLERAVRVGRRALRRVARRRRAEVARRAQQHVAAVGEIAQRAADTRIVAQHLEGAAGVEVALGKLGPQRGAA